MAAVRHVKTLCWFDVKWFKKKKKTKTRNGWHKNSATLILKGKAKLAYLCLSSPGAGRKGERPWELGIILLELESEMRQ